MRLAVHMYLRERRETGRFSIKARGQALVEFAIVIPFLILIFVGVTEFGLFFMTSHMIQNASREGARLAVVLPNLEDDDSRVISHVQNLLPDSGLFTAFSSGITNNGISNCEVNDQVTVNISGTYNFAVLKIIGINNIDVDIPTTMRYEVCY